MYAFALNDEETVRDTTADEEEFRRLIGCRPKEPTPTKEQEGHIKSLFRWKTNEEVEAEKNELKREEERRENERRKEEQTHTTSKVETFEENENKVEPKAAVRAAEGETISNTSSSFSHSFFPSFIHSGKTEFKPTEDKQSEEVGQGAGKTEFKRVEEEPNAGKTEFMGNDDPLAWNLQDAKRQELMVQAQEADVLPSEGIAQHSISPAWARRQAQYAVSRATWRHLFPNDALLSLSEMSTLLNCMEVFHEAEMLVDAMFCFADAPHNEPLKAPRAAFQRTVLNAAGVPDTRHKKRKK